MSLVESLLTAIVRLDGDALVLHVGEKPYVVTSSSAMNAFRGPLAWGQVELSTRPLAAEAVSAMLDQLLTIEQRRVLDEMGAVENILPGTEERPAFSVIAARGGDDIWIEVRPIRPKPVAAVVAEPEPEPPPQAAAQADNEAVTVRPAIEVPLATPTEVPIEPPTEDASASTEAPRLEVVQEEEQELPDEAEVTELLSGAGLLSAPLSEPIAQELEPLSFEPQKIEQVLIGPRFRVLEAAALEAGPFEGSALEAVAHDQVLPEAAAPEAAVSEAAKLKPRAPEAALPDAAEPEAPVPEAAMPEAAMPETAMPEAAMPEAAMPEAAMPEAAMPEAATPEAAMLEAAAPEAAVPAAAVPVVAEPDAQVPEATLPEAAAPGAHLEAAPLDVETAEASTPAVVVPLARTLRDTASIHAVTPAPTLDRLLKIAAARGASGLYLVTQSAPVVRVEGEMQQLGDEEQLTPQEIEAFALHLAPEPSREAVRSGATPEWFCELPELGRVRCLSFHDHRGPGLIVRMLPPRAISAEQLGLSREIQALSAQPDGLVLVAGPRSSGKSTLVAAFVDLVNRTRSDHVVTIEQQITFIHAPRKSFVSQREVRGEADEIAAAVRAALREDPDVLVVEDLGSPEIAASALEAAGSGRLVLAGLRAPGTVQAVQRLIEQFPAERRQQIQSALAASLRGVVAQVLVRKRGGGHVAARELLLNTPAAASLIAEGKAFQLPAAIESGRKLGSVALNDTLVGLIRNGIVDSGEAWRRAWDRDGLLTLLKREGIDTSFVERLA